MTRDWALLAWAVHWAGAVWRQAKSESGNRAKVGERTMGVTLSSRDNRVFFQFANYESSDGKWKDIHRAIDVYVCKFCVNNTSAQRNVQGCKELGK